MRRSTIIGAVLAGGLALAGCSPSEEPSEMPPAPGTPPPHAQESAQGAGNAEGGEGEQASGREFQQQLVASQQRVVELAEIGRQSQDQQISELADRLGQQAQSRLDALPQEVRSNVEDAVLEETEGLPTSAELDELSSLSGEQFRERWTSTTLELEQFVLQLADNAVSRGQQPPEVQQLAEQVSSQAESEIADLRALN
ncbi:DUF305 domain-containing protein [Salinifilum aidingensis]